jgi:hypothetical protein
MVVGGKTWRYQVLQRGDAKKGNDWVLVYLPELDGPYHSPEDVLQQIPYAGILRIRIWEKDNPFRLDWGGILELGTCSPRL